MKKMKKNTNRKLWLLLGLVSMLVMASYCSRSNSENYADAEEEAPHETDVVDLKSYFGDYYRYVWGARYWYWKLMGWGTPISDENVSSVHYVMPRGKYKREGCTAGPYYSEQTPPVGRKFTIEAGPIWNNGHSQELCPTVCSASNARWTGGWWTTVWNRMSVCQCRMEQNRLSFRVYSTSISDYPTLSDQNKEIILTPEETFNAASVVFLDSKLKTPYEISFEYKIYDDDAGSVWNTADGLSIMIGKDASAYNSQEVPAGGKRAFIEDGSGYGVHFELYGSRKASIRSGNGDTLKSVRKSSIFRNGEWQSVKINVRENNVIVYLNGRRLLSHSGLTVEEGYLGFGAATGAADGAHHIRNINVKDYKTEADCAQPSNVNELVSQESEESSLSERLGDAYASVVESIREVPSQRGRKRADHCFS